MLHYLAMQSGGAFDSGTIAHFTAHMPPDEAFVAPNELSFTPQHCASVSLHTFTYSWLLDRLFETRERRTVRDCNGQTALHHVLGLNPGSHMHSPPVFEKLVSDCANLADNEGRTPMHLFIGTMMPLPLTLTFFLRNGGSMFTHDNKGRTAFSIMCRQGMAHTST